jgi:dTDP-4-dehydrorhamnose reductase
MNPVDVPTVSATKTLGGQDKWSIGTNGFVVNDGASMPLRPHETFVHLETDNFEAFLAACQGVDTVVHLAADPRPNGDFHTSLLPSNVVGVFNAFEAAHQAGCRRVLFASSVHAMLGYNIDWSTGGTGEATDNTKPPNPQNTYGATKAWGEALCRKYSNADGLSCITLRVSPCDRAHKYHHRIRLIETLAGSFVQFTSPRDHSQAIIARNVAKCIDAGPEVMHTLLNWVELEDESTVVDETTARL